MRSSLLIVSPVRNEAAHIARVARAVAAQTRPPDRWVVVDDGSEDDTHAILTELATEIPFMRVMKAPPAPTATRSVDRLAAAAAPRTFNAGLATVAWGEYSHIGKLDGDVELPPEWFATLLDRFEAEPRLGIACGDLVEPRPHGDHVLPIPRHHVHGAVKTYSLECFDAIGGIHERLGWDTIDETYARMRGYLTRSLPELRAIHHRPAGSADGTLRGRARYGACAYIAHHPLPWVALRSLKVARSRPLGLSGAAFLHGYLRAAAGRVARVEDPSFRRYARWEMRQRMRRVKELSWNS